MLPAYIGRIDQHKHAAVRNILRSVMVPPLFPGHLAIVRNLESSCQKIGPALDWQDFNSWRFFCYKFLLRTEELCVVGLSYCRFWRSRSTAWLRRSNPMPPPGRSMIFLPPNGTMTCSSR